jgi:hypothetical protein
MYRKIDLKLPPIELGRVKGDVAFEYHGGVLVVYKIKDLDYFENLYKDKIQFGVKPDLLAYIEILGEGAAPHTDEATATLNYTIDDASCITSFWRVNEQVDAVPAERVDEQGRAIKSKVMGYDEKDLVRLTSFKANPGDAYLLDVSKIHSVFKPKYETVRKFLSWRWVTTPFDTVSSSIILTN